jgi:uncharacterized protein YjbI with pentapeptide repeats
MRPILVLAAIAALTATPALAQNVGQISKARNGASCPGCNLFQADFARTELRGKSFAGARLRQADLSAAIMNRSNFAGADLRDVEAYGALFTGANLAGANLAGASFVGTYLQGANLKGANLEGANFSGAEMDRALGLTQRQLNGACGDAATTLPRGLSIPDC